MIAVDVVNQALVGLGIDPLVSLDESSTTANIARIIYPRAYKFCLSLHNWNFAIKVSQLTSIADMNTGLFKYAHQKPVDIIKLINVYNGGESVTYEVQDGKILTNVTPIMVEYVYDKKDVGSYPVYFIEVLIDYLSYLFAIRLANDKTLAANYWELFNTKLSIAKHLDAQEGTPPRDIVKSKWRYLRY